MGDFRASWKNALSLGGEAVESLYADLDRVSTAWPSESTRLIRLRGSPIWDVCLTALFTPINAETDHWLCSKKEESAWVRRLKGLESVKTVASWPWPPAITTVDEALLFLLRLFPGYANTAVKLITTRRGGLLVDTHLDRFSLVTHEVEGSSSLLKNKKTRGDNVRQEFVLRAPLIILAGRHVKATDTLTTVNGDRFCLCSVISSDEGVFIRRGGVWFNDEGKAVRDFSTVDGNRSEKSWYFYFPLFMRAEEHFLHASDGKKMRVGVFRDRPCAALSRWVEEDFDRVEVSPHLHNIDIVSREEEGPAIRIMPVQEFK